MDPWINAMTTKKQRKLVSGCTKNMQQQDMSTPECIAKIKVDNDRNNNSKDMKMIVIVLIQKQNGNLLFLQPPRVLLLLLHLGGDHPTAGGQHGIGTLHHGLINIF